MKVSNKTTAKKAASSKGVISKGFKIPKRARGASAVDAVIADLEGKVATVRKAKRIVKPAPKKGTIKKSVVKKAVRKAAVKATTKRPVNAKVATRKVAAKFRAFTSRGGVRRFMGTQVTGKGVEFIYGRKDVDNKTLYFPIVTAVGDMTVDSLQAANIKVDLTIQTV